MHKALTWKNVVVAALFAALLVVPAQAAAQPSVVQSGTQICLANSDTVSLSKSVTTGDTLVVIVGGQGYHGSASTVTGVSDPVNGAWTEVANTGSITRDNTHYRSFAVYEVMSSKAASGGLSITIQSTSGQTAPSAVAVEVKGSVDVSTFQATTHVSHDGVLTAPPAPAGDLALGLFSIYQYQQSIAAGSGWTLDGAALSCSGALAEHQTLTATASPTVDVGSVTRYVAGTIAFNSGGPPPPPVPPTNTALPVISGTPQQGDTLTASPGTWTGDTPISYSYLWSDGTTGSTDTLGASDVGQNVSVTVTATNDGGSASATSANVGPVTAVPPPPSPPTNTSPPVISGTPQPGDTLTASTGSWTGNPTSYTYSWSDGTTGSSDTLSAADVGQTITASVIATNSAGDSLPATSAGVGPVTAAGPPPPPPTTGQNVAYYLGWVGGGLSGVPWNAVTQMDMFSLATCTSTVTSSCPTPASLNSSLNSVPTGSSLSSWVGTVHANGRLAMITIGGSTNPNWYYACDSADAATFASNLVSYMQTNGFDGIDLDEEQDANTGSPEFTTADLVACAQDIYQDAKAVKTAAGNTPLITADLNPTYETDIDSDIAPYVDQVNMMLYGSNSGTCTGTGTCPAYASGVATLNRLGIQTSHITAGMSVPISSTMCSQIGNYASTNGLAGTMLWYLQGDTNYSCLGAITPYVAPPSG